MHNPDLSIIILNYKMDGLLKNCLQSIFEHEYNSSLEVIVVDNNSQDQSEEIVKNEFSHVKFIQTGANLGHAKGNNIGINVAKGRYVMILNPDTVFLEPVLDALIHFLDQNKTVGMTTMQLKNPDGSLQPGAWNFHKLLTPLYQRIPTLQKTKAGEAHLNEFNLSDWDRKSSRPVQWAQGSCLIVRKETIDKIGLLDERFFLYFTDVDWCRRCWEAGYQVYYNADISLIHYYHRESASAFGLKSLLNKTTRIHVKDWLKYLHKYRNKNTPEIK